MSQLFELGEVNSLSFLNEETAEQTSENMMLTNNLNKENRMLCSFPFVPNLEENPSEIKSLLNSLYCNNQEQKDGKVDGPNEIEDIQLENNNNIVLLDKKDTLQSEFKGDQKNSKSNPNVENGEINQKGYLNKPNILNKDTHLKKSFKISFVGDHCLIKGDQKKQTKKQGNAKLMNNKMIEKKAKPLLFSIKTRRTRHQKESSDNMKQKIIVKFCNFIPDFFNGVLKGNLFKPPINTIIFRKIPYKCKTKKLLSKKIKVILQHKESSKYRSENQNKNGFNRLIKFKAIKANKKIEQLFENSAETFFLDIFLCKNYNNKIEEYEINRNKAKFIFFEEYLEELKSKGDNILYISKLREATKTLFN